MTSHFKCKISRILFMLGYYAQILVGFVPALVFLSFSREFSPARSILFFSCSIHLVLYFEPTHSLLFTPDLPYSFLFASAPIPSRPSFLFLFSRLHSVAFCMSFFILFESYKEKIHSHYSFTTLSWIADDLSRAWTKEERLILLRELKTEQIFF